MLNLKRTMKAAACLTLIDLVGPYILAESVESLYFYFLDFAVAHADISVPIAQVIGWIANAL